MAIIRRRRFLLLGAAITVTAAGCSAVDPSITGGPSSPPSVRPPSPTPALSGSLEAAALESALARQSTGFAARSGLPSALRDRLRLIGAGQQVHALAMSGPQPTRRSTATPTPDPASKPTTSATTLPRLSADTDDAVSALRDQLESASTGYADNARHTTGSTALLWGSLAVSSVMAADAIGGDGPITSPPVDPPAPLPQVTDVNAGQQLLAQLHAIIWGYRVALAALDARADEAARARAAADLRVRMRDRDRMVEWLASRSAKAPAAEPAYALPVDPTSPSRARSLIMIMESALLPFAGQWLAACDTAARPAALAGLMSSGRASVYWGGPPRTWPGWPD